MTRNSLLGSRWILTRPRERSVSWKDALTEQGAEVLVAPAIRLVKVQRTNFEKELDALPAGSLLLFTSATTVHHFQGLISDRESSLRSMTWVAVGPSTAEAIRSAGYEVGIEGTGEGAEQLARTIIAEVSPGFAVHFTSDLGLPTLVEHLTNGGFSAKRSEISRVEIEEDLAPQRWWSEFPDCTGIVFSRPSAVRAVISRGEECLDKLKSIPAVAAGETTAGELIEQGWKSVEISLGSTAGDLVSACSRLFLQQED